MGGLSLAGLVPRLSALVKNTLNFLNIVGASDHAQLSPHGLMSLSYLAYHNNQKRLRISRILEFQESFFHEI